jgi:hypothetical protein
MRWGHDDNAVAMGRPAHNMVGKVEPYRRLPFSHSDLFEAVGDRHLKAVD